MEIIWSKKAIRSLQRVYNFIAEQSPIAADKIVAEIMEATDAIVPFPEKHQVEEILGFPFRYALSGNYKIIFRIHDNTIRIYKIFDTRQDPKKMKR